MAATERGVGALVRRRRQELGLSQLDLVQLTGIDQRTISRIENNRREGYLPEPHLVTALAEALHLPVAAFVEAAGYPVTEREPEPSEAEIYTMAMRDIDRLELPERVKRIMREAVEYARELREQESRAD